MATYKAFDAILQNGETEAFAIEYARGVDWTETEATEQTIGHARYIDTIDGIGVFYNYAADYYFFTDETGENEQ